MSNKTPILVTGTLVTTPSGTQDVNLVASAITLAISATSLPLPTGAATEATLLDIEEDLDQFTFASTRLLVDGSGVIQPISGTVAVSNFPAVQPVSQSGLWTVSLATESIEIGTVDQGHPNLGGSEAWPVAVSNFPATQPVSGTVTVNQGTTPWIVNGSGFTQPVSGTITVNQGTSPWVTSISNFPATVAVTQSTSPWVISGTVTANAGTGNFTVVQPTGTNLHVVLDSGTLTSITNALPAGTNVIGHVITDTGSTTAVTGNVTVVQPTGTNLHTTVDNFPATQPISGTVTVLQGTTPWVVSLTSTTITGTVAVTQSTSPWVVSGTVTATPSGTQDENLIKVAGVTLGATAVTAYGTAPAAVNVPGVNAFITNTPAVTLASTTITGNVTVVQPTGTSLHVVVDTAPSTVVTQGTSPWIISGAVTNTPPANQSINLAQLNAVALGSPSNYGTSPGAISVQGVNAFITNTPAVTLASTTITGTVAVTQSTSPWVVSLASTTITGTSTVAGNKTNNNAAPGATNVGALIAVANAASPAWTEGNEVLLSVDLSGRNRTRGTLSTNTAAPTSDMQGVLNAVATAAAPSFTEGNLVTASVDLSGNTRIIGTKLNNNAAPSTQVGVLPAVANAAAPTWTEGDQVLESVDLRGRQRVNATLGNTDGKTVIMLTGTLVTTSVTANQVILTYTVTAGKTFYLEYIIGGAFFTIQPGNANPIDLGPISLESPAGTKLVTEERFHPKIADFQLAFTEPIPFAAGTVIRKVCTPATILSTTWMGAFGGYERA